MRVAADIDHGLSRLFRTVGGKLLLIYALGVFLPLTVGSGLILGNVVRELNDQRQTFLTSTVDAMTTNIEREFEPLIRLSELIYNNRTIYRLLDASYEDFRSLFDTYQQRLRPAITTYRGIYPGVLQVTVYSSNEAIRVAEGYLFIDERTRRTTWFEQLEASPSGVVAVAHNEYDPRIHIEPEQSVSYFRTLDNVTIPVREQLIARLDLHRASFRRHLDHPGITGAVSLADSRGELVASRGITPPNGQSYTFEQPIPIGLGGEPWVLSGVITPVGSHTLRTTQWTFILAITGIAIAISSVIALILSRSISSRLGRVSRQMRRVEREDFTPLDVADTGGDEVDSLVRDFNLMASRIDTLINDGYKLRLAQQQEEYERQRAELNALQSQVNPHFLNNALESIRAKSHARGEVETAQVVSKLARCVRRVVSWDSDMVPLGEELELTRQYADIQKYRFGDRVEFEFNVDPAVLAVDVPKLTVQAFVENACMHGLEQTDRPGRVEVAVRRCTDATIIIVRDDGAGCNPERVLASVTSESPRVRHIGIQNTYRRLRHHFEDRCSFDFRSAPNEGTTVEIRIAD